MKYCDVLLHPEKCKGAKIPSSIPVPSCSFQLHNSINLKTNNKGNLCLICNPFYLCNKNVFPYDVGFSYIDLPDSTLENLKLINTTTLWLNNSDDLTGNKEDEGFFLPVNIGQDIPDLYDQYRLVSASLIIKYIGRLDISSGVIGGGMMFEQFGTIGGECYLDAQSDYIPTEWENLSKYSDFNLIKDSYYHHENLCLEGIRALYYPIDNSYEEFVKVNNMSHSEIRKHQKEVNEIKFNIPIIRINQDYYKSGFNWMIYVSGAPQNSKCFKLDLYCNFECLPNSSYLNYMPVSSCEFYSSVTEKQKLYLNIQKNLFSKII